MSNWEDLIPKIINGVITISVNLTDIICNKRALKLRKKIKEETKIALTELLNSNLDNENNMLKVYHLRELIKYSIIDFDFDNHFKTKLLNGEIQNLINKSSYSYVYNKISVKDLELLNKIGLSSEIWLNQFEYKEPIFFLPTYVLFDTENKISNDNSIKKTRVSSEGYMNFSSEHYFYQFKYNGTSLDIEKAEKEYKHYFDSIFNLINLALLVQQEKVSDLVPFSDIETFSNLFPFALALTNKGINLFKIIKTIT